MARTSTGKPSKIAPVKTPKEIHTKPPPRCAMQGSPNEISMNILLPLQLQATSMYKHLEIKWILGEADCAWSGSTRTKHFCYVCPNLPSE